MDNIFTLNNCENMNDKIDIDELYEKKRLADLAKLETYKKILNRIHIRIKNISKRHVTDKCCWYVIPEIILGIPNFDQPGCIAYVMGELDDNGFDVQYYHPNTLLISWNSWIPTYVRDEIRNRTGLIVNQKGEHIQDKNNSEDDEEQITQTNNIKLNSNNYTPVNSYKPSGNLIYSNNIIRKLENKL